MAKIKRRAAYFITEKCKIESIHYVATVLWPSRRHLKKLTADEKQAAYAEVRRLYSELPVNESIRANSDQVLPMKKSRMDWSSDEDDEDGHTVTTNELDRYLSLSKSDCSCAEGQILQWWKTHAGLFPRLSVVARRVLCIPATSAASERNFSQAGHLLSSKRSCLVSDKVDDLLLIHHNYEEVQTAICCNSSRNTNDACVSGRTNDEKRIV
ncbi:uncharacterized protein LOC126248000 [Schistocerca nitens]|uniref:uncharacterized protein LOC126248000 n=1 Tax=Schistocerca nitens TaxID=7011 RepID=UPI002118FFA8|nr:uncharacterized protein LOC126248000 [Schistocerca nitens]